MKTAVIIGGSGLTGKKLTRVLLADRRYGKVVLLLRKPINFIHEKLVQHIFDFEQPNVNLVRGDELFCCLGTTINEAGSREAFSHVDHDYVLNLARIASEQGIRKIGVVSSLGADTRSRFFYNRVKGETERDLQKLGFEKCVIMRPSILTGIRKKKRLGEQFALSLMTTFAPFIPKKYQPTDSNDLAMAMVRIMNNEEIKGHHVAEPAEIRLTAKKPK